MDNWIVCLKHGEKYNFDYVNRLYNMCKRHCSLNFNFACLTENPSGINPNINILPLPKAELYGWWYKPYLFSQDFPLDGNLLFFDLDIVIIKNIDNLWSFSPNKFCIIKDFNRVNIPNWNKMNSSVFKLRKGSYPHVWENLKSDWKQTSRMHGDQDWIYKEMSTQSYEFWPDDWIQSYKWEIRNKNDIIRSQNNKRVFRTKENPKIKDSTSILVFHGEPKPNEVEDPIVVDNWR